MFSTLFKPSMRFLSSHLSLICLVLFTLATLVLATLWMALILQNLPSIKASFMRICGLYYICYLFCMFSFVFLQAIFIQIVAAQLQNQRPATWNYIVQSWRTLPQLCIWSLIKAHLSLIRLVAFNINRSLKASAYIDYLITFKSMSAYQAGQKIFAIQPRKMLDAVSFGRPLMTIFILSYGILTRIIIYLDPKQIFILYNPWIIIVPGVCVGAFSSFLSSIVNTAVYLRVFEKINTSYFSAAALEPLTPHEKKPQF